MRKLTLIHSILLMCVTIQAQTDNLQDRFNQILKQPVFKHASISCSVFDTKTDLLISGVNEHTSLIPASSLKLITTLSALNLLGENYVFDTKISYSGQILSDGTLEGDVFVEGSGDPSLGTADFKSNIIFPELIKAIANSIQRAGISCVDGNLIADESVFNSFPVNPTWQWNDLGNYYASGAWGINVLENEYSVYFQQSERIGTRPLIHHYVPEVPGLVLQNEIETDSAHTGDNAYIFGGPYNFKKRIVGTIPAGNELFKIKGSIPDPPLFFIEYLGKELEKRGIQMQGLQTQFKKLNKKRKTIYTVTSPKLKDLVKKANFESNNLYCESILKRLGYEIKGEGSGEMGKKVILDFFKKNRISSDGLNMVDGSGLSARNLMSSYVMANYLNGILEKLGINKMKSLIPRTGSEGTVSGLLKGKKSAKHVWAKSGSMDRVISYSGIIESRKGNILSFCFIVNGHSVKNSQISKILQELMDSAYELG